MASWDGTQEIRLTTSPESESSPRWSPDGRYLSFLSSRQEGKGAQLWLLDRRGGEARRVTEVKGGISGYAWAPDASRLVLVIQDREPGDSASESKPKPIVIDRYHFKSDGDGYLTHERSHLYLFDLASQRLDTLTSGDFDDDDPAWSPDGRRIAFVSEREGDDPDRAHNDDVYVVDARAGASPVRLTSWGDRTPGPLAWSPDGALDRVPAGQRVPHVRLQPGRPRARAGDAAGNSGCSRTVSIATSPALAFLGTEVALLPGHR